MLLTGQPLQGSGDRWPMSRNEAAANSAAVEKIDGDEPPQRGVDAAEIPEVGFVPTWIYEFRDLAVACLVASETGQPGGSLFGQLGVPRQGHANGADRGVAAKDGGVSAGVRS